MVGPVFGYLLGSLCAKIYVDFEHVDMGEEDMRHERIVKFSGPHIQIVNLTEVIILRRNSDYRPRRRPLGGGVVAGLPHRRYHHAHICCSLLVPAQVAAHPCGQTRL